MVLRGSQAVPWLLVASVALAGVAVGVVGGYEFGVRRGHLRASSSVSLPAPDRSVGVAPGPTVPPGSATPADTDVPVNQTPLVDALPQSSSEGRAVDDLSAASDVRRAQVASGRLTVRSTPARAMVTVDGRLVGETPLTLSDLRLRAYVLQVARPGYAPRDQRVSLTSASPTQVVNVTLTRGLNMPRARGGAAGALEPDSPPRGARVSIDGRPAPPRVNMDR